MSYAAATGPSGWGLVAMTGFLLLFIGLSVAGCYTVLFRGRRAGSWIRRPTAQRRLDEQFARGQIDQHEYLRLSAELTQERPRYGPRHGA